MAEPEPNPKVMVSEVSTRAEPRKPGDWKGLIEIGPAFFEPLPEDELRAWGEMESNLAVVSNETGFDKFGVARRW